MKVNFKIDLKKDFNNYYSSVKSKEHFGVGSEFFSKGVPREFKEIILLNEYKEAMNIIVPKLEKSYRVYKIHFEKFIKQVEDYWKLFGRDFLERFEKLSGKKFGFNEVDIYMTTILRCPFNFEEKWFMISFLNHPIECFRVIAHELMHFHFFVNDFDSISGNIGEEKAHDLREALTVLLNLEFKDLIFFQDKGYPNHKELREFIKKCWKEEKDYNKLIRKSASFLKNDNKIN